MNHYLIVPLIGSRNGRGVSIGSGYIEGLEIEALVE